MPRHPHRQLDTLDGLASDGVVTVPSLAAYLGMSARTLQMWCRMAWIPGSRRRNPHKETGDWLVPVSSARDLEARMGLTTKRTA